MLTEEGRSSVLMITTYFQNGINVGGWLAQCEFLCEQPPSKEHLEKHFATFLTEQDIQTIATWKFDHIRLPISGYLLYDEEKNRLNPILLNYIHACLDWCRNAHLNVILDLHDIAGNVYGAMDEPMPLLTERPLQEQFCHLWELLAQELKGISQPILLFELLNEVSDGSGGYLWNDLYQEAIRHIRAIDPDRFILVGSNGQNNASYLPSLDLLDDPGVFYNFHHYDPQVFTHQKAHFSEEMREYGKTVTYPGDISGFTDYLEAHPEYYKKHEQVAHARTNDRALMEKLLKPAFDFQKYSGKELYCGEFGVIDSAPPEEAAKWLLDVMKLLDNAGIGHAMWNYKSLDFGLLRMDGGVVSEYLLNSLLNYNDKAFQNR